MELNENLTSQNINSFLKVNSLPQLVKLTFLSLGRIDKILHQPLLVAVISTGSESKQQLQELKNIKNRVQHKLVVSYIYEDDK